MCALSFYAHTTLNKSHLVTIKLKTYAKIFITGTQFNRRYLYVKNTPVGKGFFFSSRYVNIDVRNNWY